MSNSVLTNYNYTYPGRLSTDVILGPIVENPNFLSLFSVRRGVKHKDQLSIAAPLGKILKGDQGCNNVVTGDPAYISNQTIETCKMGFYLEQCEDVFEGTILGELARAGIDRFNLSGTQLGGLLETLTMQALDQELWRIFSFGDTSNGPNDYYNYCDGLWTKLMNGTQYETTVINDGITSLSASDTKGYFKAIWEGADNKLKQLPANRKVFHTTGNVYDSLMDYYEGNANSGGFTQREEMGVMRLFYRGIPVFGHYSWDEWISTDNLGSNVRILYTTPMNHVVGIDDDVSGNTVSFWHDMNSLKNKTRGAFKMGYNYVHNELQAISYGNV